VNQLRALVAAPARLAPIDLLAAIAIAILALAFVVGPVVGQDPSTVPPTPTAVPAATETAGPSPAPTPSVAQTAAPPSAPADTSAPSVSAAPAGTVAAGSLSPEASMRSGSNGSEDPCAPRPTPEPGVTPDPAASPTPHPNLCPAQPGADPVSLLAWVFTPIFQVLFLGLAFFYSVTGDIGTAIILLTILIRILLVPVFRAQIVSQRRMQMLQPELRAIQLKYKGNRAKISEEQMRLYRERGVNPASGCLPALLQLVLLLPMYQVFSQGLSAPDISSMLTVGGVTVVNITCETPANPTDPCINPDIPWLAWIPQITDGQFLFPGYPGGLPANLPEIFWNVLPGLFGLSLLALASAILQLIQTRMMATRSDDPQVRTQQRLFLLLPAFSLIYGGLLPAGLFIYWITTTIFSIVQQFLINGYGGLFPLFGWTPSFAKEHTPRFPVTMPEPKTPQPGSSGSPDPDTKRSTTESAQGTIRPARRRSRRGRRR
jgi:YidC/Oxa1 family membrane protein insertase